jgi:hypothetical protein
MDRLKSVYSDKAYPPEREDLIWREMKNMDSREFEDVVSELIASSNQAPMIGKFREAKGDLGRKNAAQYNLAWDQWVASRPNCSYCGKKGYIMAVHVSTGDTYAFVCNCEIGQRKCPKYPRWDSRYIQAYIPNFATAAIPEPPKPTTRPDFRALAAGATKDMPQDSDLT